MFAIMRSLKLIFLVVFTIFIGREQILGQGQPYEGPDDPAGDIEAVRAGEMQGNRVFLYFQNTTELSYWTPGLVGTKYSGWPKGPDAQRMLDGVGLLVGAKVYIRKSDSASVMNPDTIPETNLGLIYSQPQNYHTLYFLQTSYREEMDYHPVDRTPWGFYPVFGYFNETQDYPAMSNKPSSWPLNGWPAPNYTTKWQGEWNGRFGRGVQYADQETYFVVNDAQDQEYLGPEDIVKYYPRPGHFIGDLRPEVTIQKGAPWGGLGLRVATRGFQWNNPQARDCIFWEYNISNISDYDITQVAFGYWVDNGIGGESDDELGYFDKYIDMAYSWDKDGLGYAGGHTGTMGFAYLESPGLPFDNKDNDDDGLVDEKRDNDPTGIIGPTAGIDDLNKFLEFYHLTEEDLKEHWDSDEDQDWEDGEDLNGDGIYQINEYAGDDVGLDGVGPGELNYNGPDEGECNHRPDFVEGVGCEPNYNATDVSESDMVGLTSFRLFPVPSHAASNTTLWFKNDQAMWELIASDTLVEYSGVVSNLIETFASGPFPLYQGRTERISMSELHSYDPLEGLESEEHSAPALFELKRIVQVIYEKDYRFAQPPKMPTLTATADSGRVILTWDDVADTRTRDPFVGNVNDFEGYKLYRSTDKYMSDPEIITDGFGTPMFRKPIFQCDLKDGKSGFTDFGLVNGVGYYLGSESGITHHFIDNTVQNGRTYYYAIVAYDYGAPDIGPGIAPSENNVVIELDESENIVGLGKNVVIATPRVKPAGYIPPEISVTKNESFKGTGTVTPEILSSGALKTGHTYAVTFEIDTVKKSNGDPEIINNYDYGILYTTSGIRVFDLTDSALAYYENPDKFSGNNINYNDTLDYWSLSEQEFETDVFDGMRLTVNQPFITARFSFAKSGWIEGSGMMSVIPSFTESQLLPWDYSIIFTSDDSAYTGKISNLSGIRDEYGSRISRSLLLSNQSFNFYVVNTSFIDSSGNFPVMDMIVQDMDTSGTFDIFTDRVLVGAPTSNGRWGATVFILDFRLATSSTLPGSGDVYQVRFDRPFFKTDSILFTVNFSDSIDNSAIKSTMKRIKVVPNPYIATNAMEPALSNPFLNHPRRLMFTHLPAECTIKIFTSSGILVDEIKVDNPKDNGSYIWDMLSREGLEIAAGMYFYHVKATRTGDEVMGKFAVIK